MSKKDKKKFTVCEFEEAFNKSIGSLNDKILKAREAEVQLFRDGEVNAANYILGQLFQLTVKNLESK